MVIFIGAPGSEDPQGRSEGWAAEVACGEVGQAHILESRMLEARIEGARRRSSMIHG